MEKIIIQLLESDDRANYILAFFLVRGLKRWQGRANDGTTYVYPFSNTFESIYNEKTRWHLIWRSGPRELTTEPRGKIIKRHE